MTDICICPGRHSGHRLASPVTASRHTPSTRAVNGSTRHFTVPWAFSRLLLVESVWGSLVTKLSVGYDLCRQASWFHAYLTCLNACLAYCLNRFLIVKALVGTVKIREVPLTALCTAQQQQQMKSFLEYFTKLHRDIWEKMEYFSSHQSEMCKSADRMMCAEASTSTSTLSL